MFLSILLAADGSPDAELALQQAVDLADSQHARLTIFTSVQTPSSLAYGGLSGDVTSALLAAAQQAAEGILRDAARRVPDSVSLSTVLSGDPVRQALLRQIAEGGHDLVVMGSRGRGAVAGVDGGGGRDVISYSSWTKWASLWRAMSRRCSTCRRSYNSWVSRAEAGTGWRSLLRRSSASSLTAWATNGSSWHG